MPKEEMFCIITASLASLAVVSIPWCWYLLSGAKYIREQVAIQNKRETLEKAWQKEKTK